MPSVTPAAFPTAGTVLTAAEYNKLPRGVLAYYTATSQSNLVTTEADFTNYTLTFTATSTRLYRIALVTPARGSGLCTFAQINITDGSNVAKAMFGYPLTGTDPYFAVSFDYVETGLSGSVTRKVRGIGTGGSGFRLTSGLTTMVGTFIVEDLGAA